MAYAFGYNRYMATGKNKKTDKKYNDDSVKELRHRKFYYSFLTIVLIFCLVQIGYSAIKNISKLVSYKMKIGTLKKTLNEAEKHNKELKEEIKVFSAAPNLEGIARNTLKMAEDDEVLIIINQPKQEGKKKNAK